MTQTAETVQPMPAAKFTTLGVKCETLWWASNEDNSTTYQVRAGGRCAGYLTITDEGKVTGYDMDWQLYFEGAKAQSPMNGARFIAGRIIA